MDKIGEDKTDLIKVRLKTSAKRTSNNVLKSFLYQVVCGVYFASRRLTLLILSLEFLVSENKPNYLTCRD